MTKILDETANCQATSFSSMVSLWVGWFWRIKGCTPHPQVPVTAPVPSQIVKHELQKDLGEGVVTSEHETCTVHVWHKKGNVTRDVS